MKYVILVLTIFLTACKMDDSIKYKVYEVDNCEYILIRVGNDRWIAHKGNCKFCAERERTKMRIKSMEETGSFNFVIGDTTESESFWIGSRWIAHKGNCKFCAERERTKMRIKSMEETGSFNFVIGDTTESESFWIGSRDKIKTNGKYATGF